MADEDFGANEVAAMPDAQGGTGSGEEQKPDVMSLLAILMGKMDAQAKSFEAQVKQALDTQTQTLEAQACEGARELKAAMQEGLRAVQVEAQRYTDEQCAAVKEELREAVAAVQREVSECRGELATLHSVAGPAGATRDLTWAEARDF